MKKEIDAAAATAAVAAGRRHRMNKSERENSNKDSSIYPDKQTSKEDNSQP